MSWVKRNLIWIVGLLVFARAVLGSLLVLKNQMVSRDKVATELDTQKAELQRLVTRAIYPDPINVKQLQRDNDQLEDKIQELQTKFAKEIAPSEALTGIKFREAMNKRLQDLSRVARQRGVTIPSDEYLYSFNKYEKTIPDNAHVPLLMKQLSVTEEIAGNHITRVEFEGSDTEAGGRRTVAAMEMPNGVGGIQNDPAKGYTMMPFELTFASDPEGLRGFLNNLSASKYILIPAYVKVKCDETEVGGKVKRPEVTPEGKVITPLPVEAEIAAETTKYVLGEQKINVSVRVDWYEFRPTAPKEGEKKERKPRKEKEEGKEEGEAKPDSAQPPGAAAPGPPPGAAPPLEAPKP
jgi:hypothetical protein